MSEPMRFFIDGKEVDEEACVTAEQRGTARVTQGGSGVVPERLRRPGETSGQWLAPWLEMETTK